MLPAGARDRMIPPLSRMVRASLSRKRNSRFLGGGPSCPRPAKAPAPLLFEELLAYHCLGGFLPFQPAWPAWPLRSPSVPSGPGPVCRPDRTSPEHSGFTWVPASPGASLASPASFPVLLA